MDMTSGSTYKDVPNRCCADPKDSSCTYYPPMTIDMPNPSTTDAGTLPNSVSGCNKMGVCVQTETLGNLRRNKGQALPNNNVIIAYGSTSDKPADLCTSIGGPGYVTDATNLYSGCSGGKAAYLCKKYVTVE